MRRILIIIILLLIFKISDSQEILNQYIVTAGQNNPALKAKFNVYMAALQKIDQASVLPDPAIAFGYFILPVETKTGPQIAKISVSQMFPWFGTLKQSQNVFVQIAQAKYEDFENSKSMLYMDVRQAYYKLYVIKKSIDIVKENKDNLKSIYNLVLRKIETGRASTSDAYKIELEMNDLDYKVVLLNEQMQNNLVVFKNLLNENDTFSIELPDTLWNDDLLFTKQTLLDSIIASNHSLKKLDYISLSYIEKQALIKKEGFPNFKVGADYTLIGQNPAMTNTFNDAFMINVGISIPLYRKKYTAMAQEALYMQESTEENYESQTDALENLAEKTVNDFQDAQTRLLYFKRQSVLSQKIILILEKDYSENNKNFDEIIRIENKLLYYQLELEKARADKLAAIAFINYLMGK